LVYPSLSLFASVQCRLPLLWCLSRGVEKLGVCGDGVEKRGNFRFWGGSQFLLSYYRWWIMVGRWLVFSWEGALGFFWAVNIDSSRWFCRVEELLFGVFKERGSLMIGNCWAAIGIVEGGNDWQWVAGLLCRRWEGGLNSENWYLTVRLRGWQAINHDFFFCFFFLEWSVSKHFFQGQSALLLFLFFPVNCTSCIVNTCTCT
jgi:hypothetical protein